MKEMSLHNQFAGQALESLNCLAKTWGIGPSVSDDVMPSASHAHSTRSFTISLDFGPPNLREEDFIRANSSAVAPEEPATVANLVPIIPAAPETAMDTINNSGVAKPVLHTQAPGGNIAECHIRFNPVQYDYNETTFPSRVRTDISRSSYWKSTHYNNLSFSPEEWRPERELTLGHRRKRKKV